MSRYRKRRGDRPTTDRRLRIEPLENRKLLAVLGLDIQLLADVNGQPGASLSDPAQLVHGGVEANEAFWVRVAAWDQRDPVDVADVNVAGDETPGVISLPLNIAWDPSDLELLSPLPAGTTIPLDPNDPVSSLVTASFPLQRELDSFSAGADAATCEGIADPGSCNLNGLQGGALPALGLGQPIGSDGPEEFSLLRFRALQATAQTPLLMQLAGSMSFEDGDVLEGISHLVDGQLSSADNLNRVTEFIAIDEPPAPETASLSGFVYADTDLDGVFDANEIGLPNVTVRLFRDGVTDAVAETTTGPDGFYLFDDLEPGTYTIVEEQNPNFVNAINTLGVVLPSNESRGMLGDDAFTDIVLGAGDAGVNYNFGENLRAVNKRFFLSAARPRDLLCEQLGVSCVTVDGTAGDDTIRVEAAGDVVRVTVNNDPPQQFAKSEFDIVTVDAGGGRDDVTLIGSSQNETAHLTTRRTSLRASDYGLLAENAESVTADGRTGDDVALFCDALENETFTAEGNTAELLAPTIDLLARARFFERVRAHSVVRDEADTDTLEVIGPLHYELLPAGKWI